MSYKVKHCLKKSMALEKKLKVIDYIREKKNRRNGNDTMMLFTV